MEELLYTFFSTLITTREGAERKLASLKSTAEHHSQAGYKFYATSVISSSAAELEEEQKSYSFTTPKNEGTKMRVLKQ